MRSIFAAAVLAFVVGAQFSPAAAAPLPRPTGDVILTVTGAISEKNQGNAAVFDRAMLERLGIREVVTTTPWHSGRVRFEGILMTDLMAAVGATGKTVKVTALNDYVTSVPVSDFTQHSPILALKQDGEYMRVRDKGPLFIIYPYDSKPELKADQYYARSAWQVKSMNVED
jgi:hypothetical protein